MTDRSEVKPLLDDLLKEYDARETVDTYYGVPLEELSKKELLAVISSVLVSYEKGVKNIYFHKLCLVPTIERLMECK